MGSFFSYLNGTQLFCVQNAPCEVYSDLESRIICTEFSLLDCGDSDCPIAVVNNGFYLCDCKDSWNCNLCGNDLSYWNIVNPGDLLYFQFQQIDNVNGQNPLVAPVYGWDSGFCWGELYSCCDDTLITDVITSVSTEFYVGLYEQSDYKGNKSYFNIQQIIFDVKEICSLLERLNLDGCFYFKFYFKKSKTSEDYDELCTEPFRCNPCVSENDTIVIEGTYPNTDCFGYYYGLPVQWTGTSVFEYVNQYRVKGSFEQISFEINKETVTRQLKTVSSQVCEVWQFRTWGVPRKIAKLISNIFSAKNVYIDGKEFQIEKEINKENEIGSQWFIDTQFKRCNCYTDLTCD